jgi:murein DD-endopeptidase MepM/ murein hydrolase activator NlpD
MRGPLVAWADSPGWRLPAAGAPQVLRAFAPPPYDWLPGHRGVDLALYAGQAVRAPAEGTVSFAGPVAGQDVVTVTHGALRSTYEPVEAAVEVGDHVAAGDLLGWLEPLTGHCRRACLHWGVLRGQTYVDPLSLVDLGPPVLLPVGPPVRATAWPVQPAPWLLRPAQPPR